MRYRTLVVTTIGALTSALLTVAPVVPVAAAQAASSSCANVVFLGARGSGEPGPGGSSDPQPDPNLGLGTTVYGAYKAMLAQIGTQQRVTLVPLSYRADGITSVLATDYLKDLNSGVVTTLAYLRSEAARCPHEKFVLAGYSQGAMIMHRALNTLTAGTSTDTAIVARVVAVALIADGDRVANDRTVLTGTASPAAEGIGYFFHALSGAATTKFSPAVGSKVFSVCTDDDIVCNFSLPLACALLRLPTIVAACALAVLTPGVIIHLSYHGSTVVRSAGAELAAKVLG